MPDGYRLKINSIHTNDATSIISNNDLAYSDTHHSSDETFCYINKVDELSPLFIELKHKKKDVNKDFKKKDVKKKDFNMVVRGSLHKLLEGRNDNDFPFQRLDEAVKKIQSCFSINAAHLVWEGGKMKVSPVVVSDRLEYLEISVNIDTPECVGDVDKYLSYNLVSHREKRFIKKDNAYWCEHDTYHIKIYQKEKLPILRFEIRFLQTSLKKAGIHSIKHVNLVTILPFYERLNREFKNIIWLDQLNLFHDARLRNDERVVLLETDSSAYQKGYARYRSTADKKERNRIAAKKYRHKKKAKQIIEYRGEGVGEILRQLIGAKTTSITSEITNYLN